jgi:hypothetical protein
MTLNRVRKFSMAAVLGMALMASAFAGLGTSERADAQVYVGGSFVAYSGPVYWWWPVWPANFYWPVYIPTPRYAAIAVGHESGRIGVSYGQWTPQDSAVAAINYCGAPDCAGLVWVGEGCAAYSRGDNGNYGWAYARTALQAQHLSTRECVAAGGAFCRVKAFTCSDGFARIYN